ncbi:MAG TPA: hypothetical protein VK131_01340 [Candidatus Acidoferrales bacterium]|nr:hypothetical protein [Candidatus Acidoferrales bacterium]
MTRETERLVELANEVGDRLAAAFKDAVPPSARDHLINAQKELIAAMVQIYEHQAAGGRPRRPEPKRRARTARGPRQPRVSKIDIH